MFDQILSMVKDHFSSNPDAAAAIPQENQEAVHNEIAQHITQGIQNHAPSQSGGGLGGMLSSLEGGFGSESPLTSAISGGLAGSLMSKFGLPAGATGAITAMLPGLLQKFANHSSQQTSTSGSSTSSGFGGLGNIL